MNKKGNVLTKQVVGFIVMLFGAGITAFTSYKGAGGIIIAIGIAIASGLK